MSEQRTSRSAPTKTSPAGADEEDAPGPAYSIRDVSRLFDLPESRLRYWSQTGFIQPSIRVKGRTWYSFRDLIGIKVARELLGAGLSLQRVRRSLDALRVKLPEVDSPLSSLRVRCEHDRVIVEGSDRSYEAVTGQGLLDFSVQTLQQQASQVLAIPRARDDDGDEEDRSAYEWFTIACERERSWDGHDPDDAAFLDARQAYDRALDLDPEFAAAYTNLAALALRLGDHDTAIAGYRLLLRAAPDHLEAHYGLARALLAVGGKGQALAHLERFCTGVDGLAPAQKDSSLKERRQQVTKVIQALRRELGTG